MSNTRCHPPEVVQEQLNFITFIFLSVKTTPVIQPKDQLIIANFENLQRALFSRCFGMSDTTNITLKKNLDGIIQYCHRNLAFCQDLEKNNNELSQNSKEESSDGNEDTSDKIHKSIWDIVARRLFMILI